MEIPSTHQRVMPYLMVQNATGFIDFTKTVFDAILTFTRMREDNKTVMHSEVQIGGCTIMFCDATEQWQPATANLFVYVENADTAFKKAIEAGSTIITELSNQPYGRSGGVKDPFGNIWWITSVI